jgi:hypothetical protein
MMELKLKEDEGGLGNDPTAALEKDIATDLLQRGKYMLDKIVYQLEEVKDAVRLFRMIENIAKHHRELIAAMHGGDTFKAQHASFGESLGLGYGVGNQEENFGAQALKGLVEGLKPKNKSAEIKSLTEALNNAINASPHDGGELAKKIKKRLNQLLDETVIPIGTVDLPSGGEAEVEIADIPKEESDAE